MIDRGSQKKKPYCLLVLLKPECSAYEIPFLSPEYDIDPSFKRFPAGNLTMLIGHKSHGRKSEEAIGPASLMMSFL